MQFSAVRKEDAAALFRSMRPVSADAEGFSFYSRARDSVRIHTGKRISVYDLVGPNRRSAGAY